jgi:hypothetical protein
MKTRVSLIVLLICAAVFVFGLYELFRLRYEVGDVYPEYSSLRSDPLGTMILYEGLGRMPHLFVRRDFSADNLLPDGKDSTYLHLAASRFEWTEMPEELVQEIERFLSRGGRLVISFFPETAGHARFGAPVATVPPASKKKSQQEAERLPRRTSLAKQWGMDFGHRALGASASGAYQPERVTRKAELALPLTLDWHSGMVFTNLDQSWRTIYARGTNAVVVERRFGPGTVVLASDSYFVSNEAQSKDRHADLLAWLVGSGDHVIFDEAHLGIVENPGVAALMRRYRLHGLVMGVLLLAGLFIWKNCVSFVPPYQEEMNEGTISGKDAGTGFTNLLRRNLGSRDLLRVCFEEWTKSLMHTGTHSISRVDQAQAVLEAENARARSEQDPVRAYQEICRVLKGHKL